MNMIQSERLHHYSSTLVSATGHVMHHTVVYTQ